jgi:hypothetical protein
MAKANAIGATNEQPETWGELGPAMRALSLMQRDFVRHLVTGKPGYGALTAAARKAGYGKNSKATTLQKHAHDLSRNPRIIAAIAEEAKKVVRGVGHAEAVVAVMNMVRDPKHRDHARAVFGILDRVDAVVGKLSVDVMHRIEDPDRAALEELKALRALGTSREKLLELYGPNGLDRLEMLEAAEIAQRAAQAKVIEGRALRAQES